MTSYFRLFCYFLGNEKSCTNVVDPGTKGAKTANIVSVGQIWARLEKKYIHSDWTSDTNIWMAGGQGGDFSPRKFFLFCFIFDQVKNCKKRLRKCPQLPSGQFKERRKGKKYFSSSIGCENTLSPYIDRSWWGRNFRSKNRISGLWVQAEWVFWVRWFW